MSMTEFFHDAKDRDIGIVRGKDKPFVPSA